MLICLIAFLYKQTSPFVIKYTFYDSGDSADAISPSRKITAFFWKLSSSKKRITRSKTRWLVTSVPRNGNIVRRNSFFSCCCLLNRWWITSKSSLFFICKTINEFKDEEVKRILFLLVENQEIAGSFRTNRSCSRLLFDERFLTED